MDCGPRGGNEVKSHRNGVMILRRASACLLLGFVVFAGSLSRVAATQGVEAKAKVVTTVAQLKAISPLEFAQGCDFRLRGVITNSKGQQAEEFEVRFDASGACVGDAARFADGTVLGNQELLKT